MRFRNSLNVVVHVGPQGVKGPNRGPAPPDELGPCVGQDEVLDTLLRLVEDMRVECLGHLTPVLHAILDGSHRGDRLLGGLRVGGRGGLAEVEGGGGVSLALLAVQDAGGAFENDVELLQFLGRDVHGELGVADTDELGVDVQGAVEAVADEVLVVAVPGSGDVAEDRGHGLLPLADAGQEGDVLAGEVVQSGEALQRGRVAVQDVLQSGHGQNTSVGAVALDGAVGGLPAGQHGVDHGGHRVQGLGLILGALLGLPLCDGIESLLTEGLVTQHFPGRNEDGENLDEEDRETNPVIA